MKKIGFLYSLAAAATWGLVYAFDDRILVSVSPVTLLFLESFLTFVVLIPVFFFHQGGAAEISTISTRNWIFILASLILGAVANFFIFSGIKYLGAGPASMIELAYPLFVALFCFFLFRQSLSIWVAVGGVFMVAGAMIIIKLG
ncbi:MAG: Integral rane protein [Patescibacteria group bacterium]|nr:Integral rane protein [Patescibacteria group bacterium]